MAATGAGNGLLQTAISLGTVFNSLASGSDAITAALTLPIVTNAASAAVDIADLELVMGASITTGSGSPYIQGTWINDNDGTNYDTYGVVSSQLYPINRYSFTIPLMASTAYTVIRQPGLLLPLVSSTSSAGPKLVLYNLSGVTFNSTVTAGLYPAGSNFG